MSVEKEFKALLKQAKSIKPKKKEFSFYCCEKIKYSKKKYKGFPVVKSNLITKDLIYFAPNITIKGAHKLLD